MVVCKFFLDGRCKYGDNCRFEHSKGGSSRGVTFQDSFGAAPSTQHLFQSTRSPFRWTSNQQQQSQQQGESTSQDLQKNLTVEMEIWQKSGMWPFSCYALEKDIPSLPDFKDMSPEELRLDAYNARDNGSFESFKQKVAMLKEEYRKIQEHMRHLPPQLQQTLVQWIDEGRNQKVANSNSHPLVKSSLFGGQAAVATQQVTSASSGPLFARSAFSASSILSSPGFGGSGAASSVFGGIEQSGGASSVFSQNHPPSGFFCQNAAKQATEACGTVFGQTNIFSTSNQPSGIFSLSGTATLNPPTGLITQLGSQSSVNSPVGLFIQPMAATDANSPVGNTSQIAGLSGPAVGSGISSVGLFGKPAVSSSIQSSVFGGNRTAGIGLIGGGSIGGAQNDASLYTPLADLTSDEKQQFQAKMFTLGKIPMRPPPLELINS